jgi:hypothetical protein
MSDVNRDQRRHPEKKQQLREPPRPKNANDPRTKNSGHGKKTADKWNQ